MAEPTLYLFDGFNLMHAGGYADPRALVDQLASFVAGRGARGVIVFDGGGEEREVGPLAVRYAEDADSLLERLAAEHRRREIVCLVSSDSAIRMASGQEVRKATSAGFLAELKNEGHAERRASPVRDRLDADTLAKLERLRRGE
jgi:predicted RNA-binding protein with PIN domain